MLNQNTFSVLFFTRKTSKTKDILTIYARITVNGKRADLSLKRAIPVSDWDPTKGRGRGTNPHIRVLNRYLDHVYTKLMDCHRQLSEECKLITTDSIRARYLGSDDQFKTLQQLIKYHNTNMVTILKYGTMKNYYTTEKYINRFLKKVGQTDDVYLKQLNYQFLIDFEQFLRRYKPKTGRQGMTNNGVMKHIERLKKLINLAVKLEWLDKNPFQKFQLKFNKFDRPYLSEDELNMLENTDLENETLQKVKDVFIAACYTGLAYIDIKNLTRDQILKGIDGYNWIFTKRAKTDEKVKIPVLPIVQDIIDKYEDSPELIITGQVFPVYSNQKMNKYLKEIMEACGIHKNITFHVARHTFATSVTLSNGVPIETVSKLLGHTKLSTTQVYARVLEKKVSEDMLKLRDKYKSAKTQTKQTFSS